MNTLKLVDTDDNISKSGTVLEDEHSAVRATIFVAVASTATVELLVSKVLEARDGRWSAQRDNVANSGGNLECLRSNKGDHDGSEGGGGEVHLDNWEAEELVCGLRCEK